MKQIENKTFEVDVAPGEKMTTARLILISLDSIPQGGFTPSQLRERDRIQRAVEAAKQAKKKKETDPDKQIIELEDSDAKNLKTIVSESRWGIRSKELLEFFEQIDKL